jgi:DNA polymerase III subunit epsilon
MHTQRAHLETEMAELFASGTKFLVVDTETTGLLKDPNGQIVEISCVDQDGLVVFSSLVKPDCPVSAKATEIHGLTDADLIDAPTFPEVWPSFIRWIEDYEDYAAIYCYNKKFDHGMLLKTAKHYGLLLPPIIARQLKWHCMMEKYAEYHGEPGLYGDYKWQRLSVACGRLGVPMSEAHRATGDCLSTLALMKALAAKGATAISQP